MYFWNHGREQFSCEVWCNSGPFNPKIANFF